MSNLLPCAFLNTHLGIFFCLKKLLHYCVSVLNVCYLYSIVLLKKIIPQRTTFFDNQLK